MVKDKLRIGRLYSRDVCFKLRTFNAILNSIGPYLIVYRFYCFLQLSLEIFPAKVDLPGPGPSLSCEFREICGNGTDEWSVQSSWQLTCF